jgi:hypothetical protein
MQREEVARAASSIWTEALDSFLKADYGRMAGERSRLITPSAHFYAFACERASAGTRRRGPLRLIERLRKGSSPNGSDHGCFALRARTKIRRGLLRRCRPPQRQVRKFSQRHGGYGRVVYGIGTGRGVQGGSMKTPRKRKSHGEPPLL